jgi:hypothetical protein
MIANTPNINGAPGWPLAVAPRQSWPPKVT